MKHKILIILSCYQADAEALYEAFSKVHKLEYFSSEALNESMASLLSDYGNTGIRFDMPDAAYQYFSKTLTTYFKNLMINTDKNDVLLQWLDLFDNIYFIKYWRRYAKEQDLSISFIACWRHPLENEIVRDKLTSKTYNFLANLSQFAATDTYSFHGDDCRINPERVSTAIRNILHLPLDKPYEIPSEILVNGLMATSPQLTTNIIPYELQSILHLFSDKRFGNKLYLKDKLDDSTLLLCTSSANSAVKLYLSYIENGEQPTSYRTNIPSVDAEHYHNNLMKLSDGYRAEREQMQAMIRETEAKLKELEHTLQTKELRIESQRNKISELTIKDKQQNEEIVQLNSSNEKLKHRNQQLQIKNQKIEEVRKANENRVNIKLLRKWFAKTTT